MFLVSASVTASKDDGMKATDVLDAVMSAPATGPTSWFYHNLVPKTFDANLAYREKICALSAEPALQEELRIMCSRDMLFEINTFGWTSNSRDYRACPERPFITYPFQDRVLLALQAAIGNRDVAFPKSRQMGCSECCLWAMDHPFRHMALQKFLLTSKVKELVDGADDKALFRRLHFTWSHLPKFLMPRLKPVLYACENLDNGSKFNGQATVPDIGRGSVLTACLNDEAAEQDNAGEIASATLAATNTRIYNSTPNGRFGKGKFFYEVCKNPAIEKLFIHWSEHPDRRVGLYKLRHQVTKVGTSKFSLGQWISAAEFASERRASTSFECGALERRPLPADYDWKQDYDFHRLKFREGEKPRSPWYDLQCAREPNAKRIAKELDLDFEGSTEKLSVGVDMETLRTAMCCPPRYRGEVLPSEESLVEGYENLRPVWLAGAGFLEVWCELPDGKPQLDDYSMGIDIAGGVGGEYSSQSVMSVWSNTTGEQVAEWRSSTVMPSDLGLKAVVLAKWFHNAMLIPEMNAAGGGQFKKKVLECEYWNWFRRVKSEEEAAETPTSKLGWHSKYGAEGIIRGLLAGFVSGEAKPRSVALIDQIEEYEFDNGKVIHKASMKSDSHADKGKQHGDCAVAGALAWMGVEKAKQLAVNVKAKTAPDENVYPEGTVGYRKQQLKREAERSAGDYVDAVW